MSLPGPPATRTRAGGLSPSAYKQLDHRDLEAVPPCVAMQHLRPAR